jgi:predicted RNA-binding protein with PUA-like domain
MPQLIYYSFKRFFRDLRRFISLAELKSLHLEHKKTGGPLASLSLFTRSRLSVHPLTEEQFQFILGLEDKE